MPARLDETVPACREALQELIRERVPLQWAASTGNQGIALMVSPKGAAMRRWRSWLFNRSMRLSRRRATAAMRLRLPCLKRNCRKPAPLSGSSPSAEGLFQKLTQNPRPHPEEAPKAPSRRASERKPAVPLRAQRSAVADAMGKRAPGEAPRIARRILRDAGFACSSG